MRIGMMADLYKPHVSGVTNYLSLNKDYLEKAGENIFIFTFGDPNYDNGERNIVRSPGLPITGTGFHFNLRYSREARSLLNTMDVLHVQHPFISGSLAVRYSREKSIPIIFTNHTRYDLYAKTYLPVAGDVIGEPALRAYLPSFCRSCDLVISPSGGMKEVLTGMGVDAPIEVIPNGVDISPYLQEPDPLFRGSLGFDPQDTVLIYTGRLGPEKNIPFLLRAFNGALQAYDNVKLLLVGDGPEKDNLEERVKLMGIQESVRFTGLVPYGQIRRYLFMADAFVTASVTEVHPLSVIEAMAAGLPVLGIASPGISDTILDGETGYIVPNEDLAGFTAKMVRMVADVEARSMMGAKAIEAAKNYAIENTSRKLLVAYQKVVKNSKKRPQGFGRRVVSLFRVGKK
ncbi:MAG: glycosyltransferase [Anaerolineales bacterium]